MSDELAENKQITFPDVLKKEYEKLFSDFDKSLNICVRSEGCDLANKICRCPDSDRLKEIFSEVRKKELSPNALCLSGGGIRSATFALGVLQGLAEKGKLESFHYLSTVSGGGYIGSWLTAWMHRSQDMSGNNKPASDETTVINYLGKHHTNGSTILKAEEQKSPIEHLRAFSNYLTPSLGLLSADTWTLVATYLRNLLLNWLVIIPLMLAVLMIPRLYVSLIVKITNLVKVLGDNTAYINIFLALGFVLAALSISYIGTNLPENSKKLDKNRSQTSFLMCCLFPFILATFFISIWSSLCSGKEFSFWVLPSFAFGVNVIGLVSYLVTHRLNKDTKSILVGGSVPIVSLVGGALASLVMAKDLFKLSSNYPMYSMYSVITIPLIFIFFSIAGTLYVGFTSNRSGGDEDREWWARCGAWVLITVVGWIAINGLVIYGPLVFFNGHTIYTALVATVGSLSGLTTLIGGFSSKTSPKEGDKKSPNLQVLLKVAAFIFLVTIVISFSLVTTLILLKLSPEWGAIQKLSLQNHKEVIEQSNIVFVALVTLGLLVVGIGMGRVINPNKFSLSAAYRNRLIRAYLGASRFGNTRKPNGFTGFDPKDNIEMWELWPNQKTRNNQIKLLPVINITLNLVGGDNLAWQERKAESFTVTPLYCGSSRLSYRKSEDYGDSITLGTAFAISGAAASPNMGYNSSPLVTLLMTLFNIRMGWWLGNPNSKNAWKNSGPNFSFWPLIKEALGRTNDKGEDIYLSDGGHFENLGLYEMVLRRCKLILVSDASCDPNFQFEDLGNAIRKIRVDLGVSIEFQDKSYFIDKEKKEHYYAIADIKYKDIDPDEKDGKLIYIKPHVLGSESVDIFNYKKISPSFPHETTADQFFSESQFESYRALGYHIIKSVIDKGIL